MHTSSAYLHTVRKITRTGETTSLTGSVKRLERRQWIAADDSGRLLVTEDGEAVQPTGDYPPGRLPAGFISSTDPAAVTAELRRRNPKGSTAAAMRTFGKIWHAQVVPPALQRLLLLDLATWPDMSAATTSWGARPSESVTHVERERHLRHVLVFDPHTGALIGEETTALDGANVPIPTPAIISSTEWLLSGYSATTAEPPQQHTNT
ncbi:hypothetical protein [Lentzea pudingi]|uniref:hypothetical protein n=1 Tax=Lentzea pudingi TaxID=1789439 RepID=UPI001666E5C6|nr:hypothetical protein [Lentzea pudingi]